jgi:hypothetical protein
LSTVVVDDRDQSCEGRVVGLPGVKGLPVIACHGGVALNRPDVPVGVVRLLVTGTNDWE